MKPKASSFASFEALGAVRDHASTAGLTPSERLVLVMLVMRAATKDKPARGNRRAQVAGVAFPRKSYLMSDTGLSEASIRRALRTLEAKGIITTTRVSGGASTYDCRAVREALTPVTQTRVGNAKSSHTDAPTPVTQTPPPPSHRRPEEIHREEIQSEEDPSLRSGPAPAGSTTGGDADGEAFELTPPEPKATAKRDTKPAKRKRKAKPGSPPDPRVLTVRDFWATTYEQAIGQSPKLSKQEWGHAMKAIKGLLETYDEAQIQRIIAAAFADDFRRTKTGALRPQDIAKDATKITTALTAGPTKPKRFKPQGSDATAAERDRITRMAMAVRR